MAKVLASKNHDTFSLLLAGDESQTLHPSGFDWGVSKDLLSDRLSVNPRNFALRNQLRSPKRLAILIDDSWKLYRDFLPDKFRIPRNNEDEPRFLEADDGILLRWNVGSNLDWGDIIPELNQPELAIVDLNDSFRTMIGSASQEYSELLDRIIYKSTQIKGLDRKTIFVVGLDQILSELEKNKRRHEKPDAGITAIVSRNCVDDIRVALSRSTHGLILIESGQSPSPRMDILGLADITPVGWEQVAKYMREEYEDVDLFDRVADLLHTAMEAKTNDDFPRADAIILEAMKLAPRVADPELLQQVKEEEDDIKKHLLRIELEHDLGLARELLEKGSFIEVQSKLSTLREKLPRAQSPSLDREAEDLDRELSFGQHIALIEELLGKEEYASAYVIYKEEDIVSFISQSKLESLRKRAEPFNDKLTNEHEKIRKSFLDTATQAKQEDRFQDASLQYRWLAMLRRDQDQDLNARAFECLAERYERFPPPVKSTDELLDFLQLVHVYLDISIQTKNVNKNGLLNEWLIECCQILLERPNQYVQLEPQIHQIFTNSAIDFIWSDQYFSSAAGEMLDGSLESLRNQGYPFHALRMAKLFKRTKGTKVHAQTIELLDPADKLVASLELLYPVERETILGAIEEKVNSLGPLFSASEAVSPTVELVNHEEVP